MPVTHRFQPGVYIREILMPANTWVVGHVHNTTHWNVVVSGHALVSINGGEPKEIGPGDVFESESGAQKWLYIFAEEPGAPAGSADMRFLTIHGNPDDCRDVATLEERLLALPEAVQIAKGLLTVDQFRMHVTRTLLTS